MCRLWSGHHVTYRRRSSWQRGVYYIWTQIAKRESVLSRIAFLLQTAKKSTTPSAGSNSRAKGAGTRCSTTGSRPISWRARAVSPARGSARWPSGRRGAVAMPTASSASTRTRKNRPACGLGPGPGTLWVRWGFLPQAVDAVTWTEMTLSAGDF